MLKDKLTMDNSAVHALLNGEPMGRKKATDSLIRIFDNILRTQYQKDSKFRRLNISSDAFLDNVISVPGALDILFEVGFQEDPSSNEHLIFPFGHSIERLQQIRNQLTGASVPDQLHAQPTVPISQSTISAGSVNQPLRGSMNESDMGKSVSAPLCVTKRFDVPKIKQTKEQAVFRNMLVSHAKQVLRYEDKNLQAKVHKTVPVARLKTTALELARQSDDFSVSSPAKQEAMIDSCFLFVLLKWFKEEFFQWVNQPKCDRCSSDTVRLPLNASNQHLQHPTPEESRGLASRIELYLCPTCRCVVRFPRYNDPAKLLDTRRGRCGEWANCFTAVCRAVGFEARYIMDNADHVWTEVFSTLEDRWLHCDSCETALDQPLMYEAGWGKKLAYVFAFSRLEIADVSWRYSADHVALQQRRADFSEKWLMNTVSKLNSGLQTKLAALEVAAVRRRRFRELAQFLTPGSVKENEKAGRTSGSLTWRLSRGEMGQLSTQNQPFVIIPTETEIKSKSLTLSYSSSTDIYHRGASQIQGFRQCTFECENISRKVESDRRMAYLARLPGSSQGQIAWKIHSEKAEIKRVLLRTPRAEFESGQVSVSVTVDHRPPEPVSDTFIRHFDSASETPPIRTLEISVILTKGNGTDAWQHAQLFRQSLDAPGSNNFELEIEFV